MSKRGEPHPAYWEYLYISIAVTAVCGVVVLARGSALFGVLLLAAVVAELLVLKVYKGRTERGDKRGS